MKSTRITEVLFSAIVLLTIISSSCKSDINEVFEPIENVTTSEAFENLRQSAIENNTQTYTINTADGYVNLTTAQGVNIGLNSGCLSYNGALVTGDVTLDYIELFDKGNMLSMNKPTMGKLLNGDKALLVSGGAFYLEAMQNGNRLDISCSIELLIPGDLTGGTDNTMTLWLGEIDQNNNLAWDEIDAENPNI